MTTKTTMPKRPKTPTANAFVGALQALREDAAARSRMPHADLLSALRGCQERAKRIRDEADNGNPETVCTLAESLVDFIASQLNHLNS